MFSFIHRPYTHWGGSFTGEVSRGAFAEGRVHNKQTPKVKMLTAIWLFCGLFLSHPKTCLIRHPDPRHFIMLCVAA